jgi:hypothetical protein
MLHVIARDASTANWPLNVNILLIAVMQSRTNYLKRQQSAIMTPSGLVGGYEIFTGTFCLH